MIRREKSSMLISYLCFMILVMAFTIPFHYPRPLSLRLLDSILSWKHTFTTDADRPDLSAEYRAFEELLILDRDKSLNSSDDPMVILKHLGSTFTSNMVLLDPLKCSIEKEIFEYDGHQVKTYWINHREGENCTSSNPLIIYLPGGGYLMGDIHSYRGWKCHLSRLFNVALLHVEYRLSPEHPLPAAVQDSVVLYQSQLMLMGDSAGGGLSLLTVQTLISNGIPVSRGVITLSSWTHLSASAESYIRNRPLFGPFEGFPAMCVIVGTAEALEDNAPLLDHKETKKNVNVTFKIGEDFMQIYPIFYHYSAEAEKTEG